MSSFQMKLSLLALVSAAAAVPHYGQHAKYHSKPAVPQGTGVPSGPGGPAYPTGGWGSPNSTEIALPTGSGAVSVPVVDDKTTTLLETMYSTKTIVSTIYATRPIQEENAPTGEVPAPSAPAQCGPETVYVTATNKVTVTVGAGAPPSSAAEVPPSSAAEPAQPPVSTGLEVPGYGQKPVTPEQPAESEPAAEPTPEPVTTAAPVPSETPVETPTPSSSSPAEKPSGNPGYSGKKRGLAYNDAELCNAFSGSKLGWAHNWDKSPNGNLPEGVEFIPTCHRPALYDTAEKKKTWFQAVDDAVSKGSTAVMGFNEPDEPTQFPISVDQACSAWKELMNPLAESHPDLNILSLSVTNGGESHKGLNYLKQFQEQCPDAVWHSANIHFYDIYDEGTVDRLAAQVKKAAELTGKKVWLSEFSLNKGSATEQQAAEFLKNAVQFLEGSDDVAGYSYFMVGTGDYMLNNASGLSDTGRIYASA